MNNKKHIKQSALPYAENAVGPVISTKAISYHFGNPHNTFVDNLNTLIAGTEFEGLPLEDIIKKTAGKTKHKGIFNNAAQVWNHTFFWDSLSCKGSGKPLEVLTKKIEESFGSLEDFQKEFTDAAKTQFGCGWAWLLLNGNKLKVMKTPNSETQLTRGVKPLLNIDAWQHSYYHEYQNKRPDYLAALLEKLINWEFAVKNIG